MVREEEVELGGTHGGPRVLKKTVVARLGLTGLFRPRGRRVRRPGAASNRQVKVGRPPIPCANS